MLMRSMTARTISPTITQISIAMPNISPPLYNPSAYQKPCTTRDTKSTKESARYRIQIADDATGFTVSQENFAVSGLDPNPLVAPHIGSAIADAANPVATKWVPAFHLILPDVFPRN